MESTFCPLVLKWPLSLWWDCCMLINHQGFSRSSALWLSLQWDIPAFSVPRLILIYLLGHKTPVTGTHYLDPWSSPVETNRTLCSVQWTGTHGMAHITLCVSWIFIHICHTCVYTQNLIDYVGTHRSLKESIHSIWGLACIILTF